MIERDKADQIQREFRERQIPDINNPAPREWPPEPTEEPYYREGAWWFIYTSPGGRQEGIIVRGDDGTAHLLLGAMASLYYSDRERTGLPKSSERFLGSTIQGRYQLFDNGIGVWEVPNTKDMGNLTYFVPRSDQENGVGGRMATALTAFFDLRGFTAWSGAAGRRAEEIQSLIERLERILQAAFGRDFEGNLFFKWTGDGAMVVSEDIRVRNFSRACCRVVIDISRVLPNDLAVGCGITKGEVIQLFMFGRYDYVGDTVNEAAKLQQFAWDEICIRKEVYDLLSEEGIVMQDAKRIGPKGYRIDPMRLLDALGA